MRGISISDCKSDTRERRIDMHMAHEEKLGVFDSGVGGFSVLKEVCDISSVDIVYFGDCARAPYGNRSNEVIVSYIQEIITHLQARGVTHFVSACNSMSVVTTNALLKKCGVSMSHYVDMTRAYAAYSTFSGDEVVLVLGTNATITNKTYQTILENKGILFYDYAFTSLAGAIETGLDEHAIMECIRPALEYAMMVNATHILYGCTHYPLVHDVFLMVAKEVGWKGGFIDPARYVAKAVDAWKLKGNNSVVYEASKETPVFKEMVRGMEHLDRQG